MSAMKRLHEELLEGLERRTITPRLYSMLAQHDYAGPGTPLDHAAPGVFVLAMDRTGATVLYTGVTLAEGE